MQIRTAMKSALSYAKHGIGISGKNPSVGCVILNSDMDLVSLGRTGLNGRPHAEKIAKPVIRNFLRPYLSDNDPANGWQSPIAKEKPATSMPKSNPEAPSSLAYIGRKGTTNPMPVIII